jgi:hypothetical protein
MGDNAIDNLRDLRLKYEQEVNLINNKLSILDAIPKAKALEGKYFKYGSGPLFSRRGWNCLSYKRVVGRSKAYLRVDTLLIEGRAVTVTFGMVEHVSRFASSSLVEITERQYFDAFNSILAHIRKTGRRKKR